MIKAKRFMEKEAVRARRHTISMTDSERSRGKQFCYKSESKCTHKDCKFTLQVVITWSPSLYPPFLAIYMNATYRIS